jgi:hypothetical protein
VSFTFTFFLLRRRWNKRNTHCRISPRKTIATAQNLYHRFHLFFPRKDFGYQVCFHLPRMPYVSEFLTSCTFLLLLLRLPVAGCDAGRPLCILENARYSEETSGNSDGFLCRSFPGTSSKVKVDRWGDRHGSSGASRCNFWPELTVVIVEAEAGS